MEFLPWKTFSRIVARHGGDSRVRTLSCGEQYRAMAFAQLTYRESLRDIEACLSAQASKLYHMGFSEPVRRSTLADANEARDWRIYADLAQRLIVQARKLYAREDLGLELTNAVYALDSTTIDLCLSVFPWAHFRTTNPSYSANQPESRLKRAGHSFPARCFQHEVRTEMPGVGGFRNVLFSGAHAPQITVRRVESCEPGR